MLSETAELSDLKSNKKSSKGSLRPNEEKFALAFAFYRARARARGSEEEKRERESKSESKRERNKEKERERRGGELAREARRAMEKEMRINSR